MLVPALAFGLAVGVVLAIPMVLGLFADQEREYNANHEANDL